MGHSSIFIELKAMIEKNWLPKSTSEFDQMLKQLEEEGHITAEELKSLMELYIRTFKDQS